MTNQKITVGVEIQSNTAKETTQAERLGAALKDAAASAQKIKVPAGGTTGVGAVMAKSQPVGAQAVMQYGQQRGTAGVTGAEARDFARQSEGLGGLVRLYATYAANVYAAGAAFRALSTAMDTANMVRGLDQIGAASGVALGGLSKQLVAATGGAISLREAMSATVKVTAAGLGSENVLRLGQVAAKASQALGVDMSDAISRLSRGITKLEPELLDELGIFTKIEPAVEKYALSVGKSAAQLTDFERRQAFANAVLAEGEKKFAAIKVDANPYNKLAASLANIAQSGLELVNKVLGPIVNFLSENPTALITALAAIGGTLLKQAVPAIGLFRQNLQQASKEANDIAQSRANKAIAIQRDLNQKTLELVEVKAEKESAILDAAEKKFAQLKEKGVASRAVQKVLKTESTADITDKQIGTIERAARSARKKGLEEEAVLYDQLATTIRNGKAAEEEYLRVKLAGEEQLQKDIRSRTTIIGLNTRLAESAEKSSFKQQVVANAAYAGSFIGPINAIKLMAAEIKTSDVSLGKFSVTMLLARGAMAAFAGAAATIGAVLASALGVITAVVSIGSILASLFSNTSKESAATSEAISQLEESTKNLGNTIDVLNKKPYLEQFNAETLSAKANALETFSSAIQKTNEAAQKELSAMNWVDKSVDVVKMIWGGDVQSKLNKEVAYGLGKAFSDAQTSSSVAGKAARENIGKLLKIDPKQVTDIKAVDKALSELSSTDAAAAIAQINAETDKLAKTSRNSATPLLAVEESFKRVAEARQKFISESVPKDTFSDFGRALISGSFELEAALKNPETRLQAIRRTFDEIKNIGGIPQDLLLGLQDASQIAEKVQVLNVSLNNTSSQIDKLTSRKDDLEKSLSDPFTRLNYDKATKAREELESVTQQIDNLQKSKEIDLKVLVRLDTDLQAYNNTIKEAQIKVFETGSQVVANKLNVEFAKAGATISKAIAGILPDTEEGIALRAKSDVALINAQIAQVKAIDAQIAAQIENTLALKERALADKMLQSKLLASTEPDTAAVLGSDIIKLDAEVKALRLALKPGGSFKQLSDQRIKETRTLGESAVSLGTLKLAESRQGNQARIQQLAAEAFAIIEGAKTSQQDAQLKVVAKRLQDEEKSIALDKQRLISSKELSSELSEQGALLRQSIEARESALKTQADLLEIDLKIKKAERSPKDFPKAKAQFELEKQRLQANQEEEAFNKRLLDAKELITIRSKVQAKIESDRFVTETNSYNLQTQALDNKQKALEFQKQQGILTDRDYILQKNSLDVLQANLNYNREISAARKDQKLALIEQTAAQDRLQKDIEARRQQDSSFGPPQEFTQSELEGRKLIADEVERINKGYRDSIGLTDLSYKNTLNQLQAQKQLSLQQEEFNNKLNITKGIGESLASVFGKFGTAIGEAGVALTELNNTQKINNASVNLYDKKLTEINDTIDESQRKGQTIDPKLFRDRVTAQEDYNKAIKKAQTDEISGNLKVLGSAKKMFKEKSAGYKAISAIEKVMHVTKLAMDATEIASNISKTAQIVINAGINAAAYVAEAGAAGLKAIANAFAAPFPIGFVAGAAMAAIIGGLLGTTFGGGGSPKNFVPTSEQRQETQGTAMSWDLNEDYGSEGKKIRTREGVFGDTSAKSESIAKSLELIANNSVDGLQYDNKMLRAFEKLNQSMEKLAISIYNVKGISAGTGFDTMEGTRSSGISWFFGKSTTKEITDSGLVLKGNFLELAKATGGVVQQFEEVKTTTNRKGFLGIGGSTNISINQATKDLDPKAQQAVNEAFAQGYNTILTLGVEAGLSQQTIDNVLKDVSVDELASLRGLTGEALKDELQAVFGAIFDDASLAVFDSLKNYRKFGEGMLETATRVINTNKTINQLLENINTSGTQFAKFGFEATESIADLFGGVDKAVTAFQNFEDAILTDEQKIQKKRERLSKGLATAGLTDLKTREDYNRKYQELVTSGQTNTETFRALIELGQDFGDVVDELTNKVKTAFDDLKQSRDSLKDILKGLRDFRDSLNKTIMTPGQLYLKAKKDFETLAAKAAAGDYESARKIGEAGETFRAASSVMFASSDAYVADVRSITGVVDSLETKFAGELTDAEKAMNIAISQDESLREIAQNTDNTQQKIQTLLDSIKQREEVAPTPAPAAAAAAAPAPDSYTAITSSDSTTPAATAPINILDYILGDAFGYNSGSMATGPNNTYYYPENVSAGATGSNYIMQDQMLFVHKGERLMPAADNRQLMKMVSDYSGSGNSELYDEVCRLTKQVEVLTQVVADGAILNAQATDRNTDELATTIQNTGENTVYNQRLQNRTAVV
jgi:hypothetical protein